MGSMNLAIQSDRNDNAEKSQNEKPLWLQPRMVYHFRN